MSYKFANYRNDSSWDRPISLDMQIGRSQLDNLRHQTLIDERNTNARKLSPGIVRLFVRGL